MNKMYSYEGVFMLDIGDGWVYLYNEQKGRWYASWITTDCLNSTQLVGVNYNETRR